MGIDDGDDRKKRRILVTFSKEQIELINIGIEVGMAFNRADYIRKAVDKLNEEIPKYQAILEREKAKKELAEELDRQASERKM